MALINDAIMCKQFKCLPYAGGLYDQPPGLIERFNIIYEVLNERERVESKKQQANARQR